MALLRSPNPCVLEYLLAESEHALTSAASSARRQKLRRGRCRAQRQGDGAGNSRSWRSFRAVVGSGQPALVSFLRLISSF